MGFAHKINSAQQQKKTQNQCVMIIATILSILSRLLLFCLLFNFRFFVSNFYMCYPNEAQCNASFHVFPTREIVETNAFFVCSLILPFECIEQTNYEKYVPFSVEVERIFKRNHKLVFILVRSFMNKHINFNTLVHCFYRDRGSERKRGGERNK